MSHNKLRQISMLILLLLTTSRGFTQSATQNYIATWTATAPITDPTLFTTKPLSDVKLSIQYFDSLGRPVQAVAKQGSLKTVNGSSADLVRYNLYDVGGRDSSQFLPYAAGTTDGSYKTDALTAQPAFYNGTNSPDSGQGETGTNAHTAVSYEASPLNRVLENFPPGDSWVGTAGQVAEANRHSIKQKYFLNTATDSVRIWNIGLNTTPGSGFITPATVAGTAGIYPAGTLYKNIIADEAGHQVIEYKDKDGHLILRKVQLTAAVDAGTGSGPSGWLCTYNVFDVLGLLRCVIQPQGVQTMNAAGNWTLTMTLLNEQCFRYEYDQRNRIIMKQVPGAGAVYMAYDARDRLVLTQDANLRAANNWIATKYDDLNRADTTWFYNTTTSFSSILTAAAASSNYIPTVPTSATLLTQVHYDDYTGLPSGLSATYLSTWNSYFSATSTTTFPYPEMPVQNSAITTKGLATWTQQKILDSTQVAFLPRVTLYDDKGRVIQTQTKNITGGTDVITTQYSWAGQPLVVVSKQEEKKGSTTQTTVVVTKMTYDNLGRVVKTETRQSNSGINGGAMSAYATISQIQYDAIGQLKKKLLGNQKTSATTYSTLPLETQDYDFNIRGWLLGVNRAYARDASSTNTNATMQTAETVSGEMFTESGFTPQTVIYPITNYFGFDLGYDKTNNNLIGGKTYTAAQYNGNITGMVWKGANDMKVRKYDFTYDAANRLTAANFGQYTSTNFTNATVNYNVSGLSYDANGNILKMNQYGLKTTGSSAIIDQLTYNYTAGTNRLLNVVDSANDNSSTLGDFKYAPVTKTTTTVDYTYDANGNMITDANKKISSIAYNYLNLPSVIRITGKGSIYYTYDATGNKLRKKTVDSTVLPAKTIVTTYITNAVYQNDTLQFFGTTEGRARPVGAAFVYDYFLKDHLDNTRMVITDDYNVSSPILEATSYYPFGLTMAEISSKAAGALTNKYLFNSGSELQNKEFSDGSGLELYDAKNRMYDPQIGRFGQIDQLAQLNFETSPFVFANNNPILLNDPLGLLSDSAHPIGLQEIKIQGKKSLDTKNGQVLEPQSRLAAFFFGGRSWEGHDRNGNAINYEVNRQGYLTGNRAMTLLMMPLVPDETPILTYKQLVNLKNFIKREYIIYKYTKNGLPYIGKALESLTKRYGSEENVFNLGVKAIEGLDKIPTNAVALGVEQIIIDLNGGINNIAGKTANINNATIKEIYINEARYWLDNNMPGWEQTLKFQ